MTMMGLGEILGQLGIGKSGGQQQSSGGGIDFDSIAKSWLAASQSGSLSDGSDTMSDFGQMFNGGGRQMSALGQAASAIDEAAQQAPAATPVAMIQPPSFGGFNVTDARGTKPGNYRPTQLAFDTPTPSVLQMFGLGGGGSFDVTPASGGKPKNYRPMELNMTAPQPVGAQNLQQILMAMNSGQLAPFGTRQG